MPQNHFNKGDGINFSIADASIVAKTYRDRLMDGLDGEYPGYGFARHKGYGTPEHQEAIRRLGPSAIHRMSFPVIRELCGELSPCFYAFRRELDGADSRPALEAFEARLDAAGEELAEPEERKLRIVLARRWKVIQS
jgi:ribonuclease HII